MLSFQELISSPFYWNLILSFLLIVSVILARAMIVSLITRRTHLTQEVTRRWIVHTRTFAIIAVIAGLVGIWSAEIRSVAFSFVALAVAIVIATKELILCVLGGLLRGSDRPFTIGDRIEVNHIRGDVIDQALFTTTVLEVGPGQDSHQYTGRAVVVPNSVFLNSPVVNETYTMDFVLHVFRFPMTIEGEWQQAEKAMLEAARAECAPFLEQVRNHMRKLAKSRGLETPTVEPRVFIQIPEPGRLDLVVRIPAPARMKGRVEQAVIRRFLSQYKGRLGTLGNPQSALQ